MPADRRLRGDGALHEASFGALVDGGEAPLAPQDGPVRPLPTTRDHALDLSAPQDEALRMEGGAMGRLERARLDGVEQDFRQLVAARRVWALNGVAGDMDEPAFRAAPGRTVRRGSSTTRPGRTASTCTGTTSRPSPAAAARTRTGTGATPSSCWRARPSRSPSSPTTPAAGCCTAACSDIRPRGCRAGSRWAGGCSGRSSPVSPSAARRPSSCAPPVRSRPPPSRSSIRSSPGRTGPAPASRCTPPSRSPSSVPPLPGARGPALLAVAPIGHGPLDIAAHLAPDGPAPRDGGRSASASTWPSGPGPSSVARPWRREA